MERLHAPGFSLPELLITLAIVAILATITVPSFTGVLARARRGDAMSALLRIQLAQERWRSRHLRYADSLDALGLSPKTLGEGHYQLSVESAGHSDFLAIARPGGVQRRDACGTFAVRAGGPVHGGGYADAECWRR
ncbi:MAG TPA: prepilin-type N-terminal cleavage/methylation domain-containing protein [Gammaproteobacteria bacterium]|nr:prepilin-type N-terminal cleavage/methylation domain-containing protein [Gammaproteobacteria bacterium]